MTKTKSTKRALLMSALALLVCVSMLIGSTFAWFTDSVTSSGNIIKSGTLDVEMYWAKGTEDPNADATAWTDASTGAIFNNDKWEPGYTEVRHIKIANEGTLALKYQLSIVANGAVSKLADVIDVYFVDPAVQVADRTALNGIEPVGTLTEVLKGMPGNASGDLLATETDTITLALKMQETAGNEYQDLAIGSDFAVQLLATQLTSEFDSFDNQYDVDADYVAEVKTADELATALRAGGLVKLANDISVTETLTVPAGVTVNLDLNGKTITGGYQTGSTSNHIYAIDNKGTLTLKNGTINSRGVNNYGAITLESGTINSIDGNGGYGVRNYAGASFVMNGGTIATTLEDDHQVDNGGYDATTLRVESGATFEMNGGVINNICDFTFAIDNYGTAAINAGKVSSVHTTVANYGTLTVNGGELVCNGVDGKTQHVIWASAGTTTINKGTFDGKDNYNGFNVDASAGATVTINGGSFLPVHSGSLYGQGTITVYGGTFANDVSDRVADGYIATKNADGTYTVVKGATVANAAEFTEAIKNGGNVVLTDDIVLTNKLETEKDVVLDLNGKTITAPSSGEMFQSKSGPKPSLTITSSVDGAEINVTGGDTAVLLGYGSTEIKNVTINITGCDNYSPSPFKVYGDLTIGEGTVVNVDYLGSALINNNGKVAISIDGAEFNIGTFKRNGLMIDLNNATTFEMKNTTMKIDNYVLSQFGGEGLIKIIDGVTIENCTFDITDSNGASCTFVADAGLGRYDLVQK